MAIPKRRTKMKKASSNFSIAVCLLVLVSLLVSCAAPTVAPNPGQPVSQTQKDTMKVAASTFSDSLCDPVDPSVVANIPKAVSGFSGYSSEPGDWLTLPTSSPLKGKKVALTVMGLGQPFFLSIKGHWEEFAKKYEFELKVFDGRFDAGTVQKNVEDIIAWKPDAVAFAPLDSDASVAQVKKIQEAGIVVITYNVQPREQIAPRVFADDWSGSRLVGCNMGRYYKEMFGDKPALIGVVDLPQLPQVQDRKNGFYYGFLSVVPNAVIGQTVDGGGVIDKANPAATDLIQANPNMNVIFGINNDSSLGTLRALKAAGKYNAEWGVLGSVDGSAPVMVELGDPNTPYKSESGYPPYDFSIAPFILLGLAYEGKADKDTQVVLSYPPISPTESGISTWVNVQYPSR
jgi:ABC-type sugar transport system substrate-binding protein